MRRRQVVKEWKPEAESNKKIKGYSRNNENVRYKMIIIINNNMKMLNLFLCNENDLTVVGILGWQHV